MFKRFQFFGKEGIEWTKWFRTSQTSKDPQQLGNKLKNEYKDEE